MQNFPYIMQCCPRFLYTRFLKLTWPQNQVQVIKCYIQKQCDHDDYHISDLLYIFKEHSGNFLNMFDLIFCFKGGTMTLCSKTVQKEMKATSLEVSSTTHFDQSSTKNSWRNMSNDVLCPPLIRFLFSLLLIIPILFCCNLFLF